MLVPLERVPFFLRIRVSDQNTLLLGQNAMEERGLVRDKSQGSARSRLFRLFRAGPFSKGENMRAALGYQHPSARVRNQLFERRQQGFHDEIHPQVLSERKRGLAQRLGFLFRLFLRSNLKRSTHEPANLTFGIPNRKAADPHPADFAPGRDDPESFVEVPAPGGLVEFREHMNPVLSMDEFFVRGGVLVQRLAGMAGDGLISGIHKERFLGFGIDHPEDFLDVVRHLLKAFLAFEERHLGPTAFGDVTQNHYVLAGQAVGFGCVLNEDG